MTNSTVKSVYVVAKYTKRCIRYNILISEKLWYPKLEVPDITTFNIYHSYNSVKNI